jgi:peptidoglycan/xylan/chitin deacetylase (PgdA/CDA1 family)
MYVRAPLLLLLALAGAAEAQGTTAVATKALPAVPKKKPILGWAGPAAGPTLTGDPELIFTFDDGPDPKRTPFVLDALAAHHIHAIFFMVGRRLEDPNAQAVVDRILREGHIIANHSWTHQDLCQLKDEQRARDEIDKGKQLIEAAAKMQTVWFRVPYGVRCERVDELLAERGLQHFHWDLDPKEWKHGNVKKTIEYVEKNVGKIQGRNVLLMHDIKKATVEALPVILDWLDQENARRLELRIRRIRVIQSYELAAERLPPGLVDWLGQIAPDRQALVSAVASVLP